MCGRLKNLFYIPDLIKKKVVVTTELGDIEGTLIHLRRYVVLLVSKSPQSVVILRSWKIIKWL